MDSTTAIPTPAEDAQQTSQQEVGTPAIEEATTPAVLEDPAMEICEEGTPAAPATPLLGAEADEPVEQSMNQAAGDHEAEASSQEDIDKAEDEGSKKRKREESDDPSQAAEESDAQPPEDDVGPTKNLEADGVDDEQEPPSKRQAVESLQDPQQENEAPNSETEPEIGQEGPNEDQNRAAEEAEMPATPVLAAAIPGKVLMAEADVRTEALKVEE